LLDAARAKLLAERGTRVRPGLDDKILTGLERPHDPRPRNRRATSRGAGADRSRASRRLTSCAGHCWRGGRLYASWKDGRARHPAYLDDHAFLLDALLESLQSRFPH
jgi:uncharacterized protein YyaL (SSP411 family)